jgi:signal transduction histidine kinase/ActR/RegA family two-component response regulator
LLFIALRDLSYLLYVAFVASMALTIAVQAGLAKEFLWNDSPLWSNMAANVGYSISLATLLTFMRHMLNTGKVIAHLDRLILPLIGLHLVAPIGFAVSLTTFVKPAAYLYGATGLLILGVGIWCVYKRQRSAYYFVAAFGVLCLAAIASVLRAMDILATNYLTVNALQFGSGIEMLLLAFALADRFNEIRAERARAQADALQAQRRLVSTLQRSEQLLADRVQQRTNELDQKNEALTQAMSSLETVERIARHDLKTPLGSLIAAPALLRAGRQMSEQEEAVLCMMEKAASRALRMVNLSLDMFRMESGSYISKPRCVDLVDLAALVVLDLGVQAESKAVVLRVAAPKQPVLANAEEELCYSIMANIVKNAVEAAPVGTEVCITLEQGRSAMVRVHNYGAVPVALRANFFAKYATSGKVGGTGLGTYSSHLLACVQGGSLSMTTSEATGTTLTLVLNRWQPTLNAETNASPVASICDVDETDAAALGAARVLVVDDDEFNRLILIEQLPQHSLKVEAAINGRQALEFVKLRRPDLIIMDIEMPVLGGVAALQLIREFQAAARQQPSTIVAYSGNGDEQSQAAYLLHGFDRCLSKPVSREQLMAMVRELDTSVST